MASDPGRAVGLVLAAALALATGPACAQMRKCIAENGRVSYIDGPCPVRSKEARMQAAPETSGLGGAAQAAKPQAAAAGDVVMRYYDVEGADHSALALSMKLRGPKGFRGYTEWNVNYKYLTLRTQDGRCRVSSVEPRLQITMTMPRWAQRAAAPAELETRFARFEQALLAHEEGHADHGRQLAAVLPKALMALAPQADCGSLDTTVRARFERLLGEYNERDRSYDARTNHGVTQGAHF